MKSLQKPKKFTLLGSDGKVYGFLAKLNDDLRKDARTMDFNIMINSFLKKDSQARNRELCKEKNFFKKKGKRL
jgi:serine/threonine-protein kinase ATR